jgi:cytochrome c oxidase subunit 2
MNEHDEQDQTPIPFGQILFDDVFLLLLLGLVMPFIIYTVWGLMDIGGIPTLPPTEYETAGGGIAATETVEIDGASLAQSTGCMACHTTDGNALVGPSWLGIYGTTRTLADGSTVEVDDAYLRESIEAPNAKLVEGFAGLMPAYAGQLSSEEINALVDYIKSLR